MASSDQITDKHREAILSDLAQHPIAGRLTSHTRELALNCILEVFDDLEYTLNEGACYVKVGQGKYRMAMEVGMHLAPSLASACHYFNGNLPQDLIHKLRNKTQTINTLFELDCLGLLQICHRVTYEPELNDGKIPDLMVSLPDYGDCYIECKSQSIFDAQYAQDSQKLISDVLSATNNTPSQVAAWEADLRTEVHIQKSPSSRDIEILNHEMQHAGIGALKTGLVIGDIFRVNAVPREQACLDEVSAKVMSMTINSNGTYQVNDENAHTVAYGWPAIDIKRRRSQRKLLRDARIQLRAIPENSYGLIFLNVRSTERFIPDVHKVMQQAEYNNIPLVWLNPSGGRSEAVWRNDMVGLKDAIIAPLIIDSGHPSFTRK